MLTEPPVTFFSVWMLGVALGLTACTVTCLPFMGTWALGRQGNMRLALWDTLAFLSGRLCAYVMLGMLAGGLGAWLVLQLATGVGNALIGLASLLAALVLLFPRQHQHAAANCQAISRWASGSPFLIGVSLTLIPCAPLTTLLATCAAGNSTISGGLYGAAFGAGTVLTPMLVLIPACARFGLILREQGAWLTPYLQALAALVLILLGLNRIALFSNLLLWSVIACLVPICSYTLRGYRQRPKQKVIPIQPLP